MPYTFQSKCCANITMLNSHAKQLIETIGKDASEAGIVTVEQIPAAVAQLQTAITQAELREQQNQAEATQDSENDGWEADNTSSTVSLRARYTPVLQMLAEAAKHDTPVIWELDG